MKKIIVSLCCIFAATLLFAEVVEPESIESGVTQGTFGNEIDDSFNAGTSFGDYDQHFIFGGLGNPDKTQADGSGGKFTFGYYMPGKLPMSFYGVIEGGGTNVQKRKTEIRTYQSTYPHDKIIEKTVTEYQRLPLFKNTKGSFNYLIGFSAGRKYVTGILLSYDINNAWVDASNQKVTKSRLVNNALTETERYTQKNFTANSVTHSTTYAMADTIANEKKTTLDMRIPFAFATGSMNHTFGLDLGITLSNRKGSLDRWERTLSSTPVVTNTKASFKSGKMTFSTALKYDFSMSAGESRPDDRWTAGAKVVFINYSASTTKGEVTKTDNTPGAALNFTHSTERTYRPGNRFQIILEGGRLFSFASAQKAVLFNVHPKLKLSVSTGSGAVHSAKSTSANRVATGSSVLHSKTVTTHDKREDGMGTTTFVTTISVPMGLELRPENWKVGFLLGAKPELTHTITHTHKQYSGLQKTETTSGTATTSTTTVTGINPETDTTGSWEASWAATEQHKIGITIPFAGGAHLDATLGGTLLEINKFTIQAFIPLGSGKKAAAAADTSAPAPAETAAE